MFQGNTKTQGSIVRDSEVVSVGMMSCEHQNVIEFKVSKGKKGRSESLMSELRYQLFKAQRRGPDIETVSFVFWSFHCR